MLNEYLQRQPNLGQSRVLKIGAWVVTALVLVLVALMRVPEFHFDLPGGQRLDFLPPVHAALNSLAAVFLVLAVVMIKRGNVIAHQRFINSAMVCSALFLMCYVAYHFTTPETKFGGTGAIKVVYLILLISHIVLAAASLPFILLTYIYAYTNQFAAHRKMAKWVFPVWLYVAVTGPICYLMLKPYY